MLSKIKRKLYKWFFLLINILSLPIFALTFIWIFFRVKTSKSDKKNNVLFTGLEHVINKTLVRADQLAERFEITFYSFESSKSPQSKYPIFRSNKFILIDLISFGKLLKEINPKYCEIYFEGNSFRQFYQILLLRSSNTMSLAILRGELYYFNSTMSIVKKKFLIKCLNAVDWIYYRETYMLEILQKIVKGQNKIVFDSNKVKVYEECQFERKEKIVLFLNGFKKWRRLDIVIDAIPAVLEEVPEAKFVLVGARSQKELSSYAGDIPKEFEDKVTMSLWTKNSKKFFEKASVFVLPADLIYLNFSLLEAMERGVPPIIADVEDVDKIIENEKEGIITEQKTAAFSKEIIRLLKDEKLRLTLAENTRKRIVDEFNDKDRMHSILQRIEERYNEG